MKLICIILVTVGIVLLAIGQGQYGGVIIPPATSSVGGAASTNLTTLASGSLTVGSVVVTNGLTHSSWAKGDGVYTNTAGIIAISSTVASFNGSDYIELDAGVSALQTSFDPLTLAWKDTALADFRTNTSVIYSNLAIKATNFVGTLALPNIATNTVLMSGGGSNVVAATIGSGLTFSGGTLSSSGGGGGPSSSNNIPFTAYSAVTGTPKTNIVIDAALGTVFRVLLTNNMGLLLTNGSDGQDLSIELYQDGTGNRTVHYVPNTGGADTNNWVFGEEITSPITLTTNAYKKDLLKLRYEVLNLATNTSRSNWNVIGLLRKY